MPESSDDAVQRNRGLGEDPVKQAPLVVAVDMGFGHLRAARAIAEAAGTTVAEADRPPLADESEMEMWDGARNAYERLSRGASLPWAGPLLSRVLDGVTSIPRLRGDADLSAPNAATRWLARCTERGLGRRLAESLRESGRPLVSTFYAPAIAAAAAGAPHVTLVVTDTDVNRVWAAADPRTSPIRYCVPAARTRERLLRYGVPPDRIAVTGFPLPPGLLGGADHGVARALLSARLARLDPQGVFRGGARPELEGAGIDAGARPDAPPLVALAIGGAGAQVGAALDVLTSLRAALLRGSIRVALIAGRRAEIAASFRVRSAELGLPVVPGGPVEILCAATADEYFARFEELAARTDVLWTKPSELTFYAALGIPLLLARPLGVHERRNRRFLLDRESALDARDGRVVSRLLSGGLADGSLAGLAWNGWTRITRDGTARIVGSA